MGLANRAFTINPFCLEPTVENRHFLVSFVRVLLQSSGQYRLTMQDDRDLHEAVENIYALDAPQRRLFTLSNILPRTLSQPAPVAASPRAWAMGSAAADTSRFNASSASTSRPRQVSAPARTAALLRAPS
jgi:type IV secretory pathway VirB4 component